MKCSAVFMTSPCIAPNGVTTLAPAGCPGAQQIAYKNNTVNVCVHDAQSEWIPLPYESNK